MIYHRPDKLEEALAIRSSRAVTVLAGGTDVYPAKAADDAWAIGRFRDAEILDISLLDECRGIERREGGFRIGALATWTDVIEADLPPGFDALKQAAREVGGWQIQNRGTIAGNLCNASPAADGIPPLLILDAVVELASSDGVREVPLSEFLDGYRSTACMPAELVTAIHVPDCGAGARTGFVKLGARRYLVISTVMVAALIEIGRAERIVDLRVAVGACSAVARRLTGLEARLRGAPSRAAAATLTAADLSEIDPIDDVRASAEYRAAAALTTIGRLLGSLGRDGPGR